MKYTIVIQCKPEKKSVLSAAIEFIEALYRSNHQINQVFFYGEGVYLADSNCVVAQDEVDYAQKLKALLAHHEIPNTVCIATAIKRGVLDEREQQRYEKLGRAVEAPFELGGLGQLIESCAASDRTITFV